MDNLAPIRDFALLFRTSLYDTGFADVVRGQFTAGQTTPGADMAYINSPVEMREALAYLTGYAAACVLSNNQIADLYNRIPDALGQAELARRQASVCIALTMGFERLRAYVEANASPEDMAGAVGEIVADLFLALDPEGETTTPVYATDGRSCGHAR